MPDAVLNSVPALSSLSQKSCTVCLGAADGPEAQATIVVGCPVWHLRSWLARKVTRGQFQLHRECLGLPEFV